MNPLPKLLISSSHVSDSGNISPQSTKVGSPTSEKYSEPGSPGFRNDAQDFPEGGRGWWVVLGSFLLAFCSAGLVTSWVFQNLYQDQILPASTPSAIAWIGSIQLCLTQLPGLVSGHLLDMGYLHTPVVAASTLLIISTVLVAECTAFWQFLLVQGILSGISFGFVFMPAFPIVSHFFDRKRSTAVAIVSTGAAAGGTVFPIVIRELIPRVGLKWTMRILGLILLALLALANILVRLRLPPKSSSKKLVDFQAFTKSPPYSIYVAGAFIGLLGMYTPLTFFDVFGVQSAHLSEDFSFYIVSIANAASIAGRVAAGILSDKYGCLNTLLPFNVIAAAATFTWPYCVGRTSLVAVATVYGAASGAFIGLLSSPVAHFGDVADIGRRTGMMFSVVSLASLVGPPISGAILTRSGGFQQVGVYAGCTILVSSGMLLASKVVALKAWRGKL